MFAFTSDRSFYRTAPTHRLGYSALSGQFLSPGHPQVASSGQSTPRQPITMGRSSYLARMGKKGRLSKHNPAWQRIRELHAQRFGR
jgi:hypothetical protein